MLVPWGPPACGHLEDWLDGIQVGLELGSLPTICTWSLVTRGPAPAFRRLRRQEGGFLVTTFRAGLVLEGPPSWGILGSQAPPSDECSHAAACRSCST